jgi:hypothetical protein
MRKTTLLAAALLALGFTACKGSVSKEECAKLGDHMTDVVIKEMGAGASPDLMKAAKDQAKEQMAPMIDSCVKEASRSDYDCVMAANTMAEIEKCGGK